MISIALIASSTHRIEGSSSISSDPNLLSVLPSLQLPQALHLPYNTSQLRALPISSPVSYGSLDDVHTQMLIVDLLLDAANALRDRISPGDGPAWRMLTNVIDRYQWKKLYGAEHQQSMIPKWHHGIIGEQLINSTMSRQSIIHDPGSTSIWCSHQPMRGYGPLWFAFGTNVENQTRITNVYPESTGNWFLAFTGPMPFFSSDGKLTFASAIYKDNSTRAMVLDAAMRSLSKEQYQVFARQFISLEEALVERFLVTIARIHSFDRANVAAEGNLQVVLNQTSMAQTPFGASPCATRMCLGDVGINSTTALQERVIDRLVEGQLFVFVGRQWFDEHHPMIGLSPKAVLIGPNGTHVVDMWMTSLHSSEDDGRYPPHHMDGAVGSYATRQLMMRRIDGAASISTRSVFAGMQLLGYSSWTFVNAHSPNAKPYACGRLDSKQQCLQTSYTQYVGMKRVPGEHVEGGGETSQGKSGVPDGVTGDDSVLRDPTQVLVNGWFQHTSQILHPLPHQQDGACGACTRTKYCSLGYKSGYCTRERSWKRYAA